LAEYRLARLALSVTAKALVSASVVISKLTYGRADARVDGLPGNIEEVALKEDVGDADLAAKARNTGARVIGNGRWQIIEGEILVVLAKDDILRAFRHDPVSESSIG
jgi:hypothetical protein